MCVRVRACVRECVCVCFVVVVVVVVVFVVVVVVVIIFYSILLCCNLLPNSPSLTANKS